MRPGACNESTNGATSTDGPVSTDSTDGSSERTTAHPSTSGHDIDNQSTSKF